MGKYNPNMPDNGQTGAALIGQLLANDAMNLQADPEATISGGLQVGTVVVFNTLAEVWAAVDLDNLPNSPLFGIIEEVNGNKGQVRTAGTYQAANIIAGSLYYCETGGFLTTEKTDLLVGQSTSQGNLSLLLNGGSNLGKSNGINVEIFDTAGEHYFTVPKNVTKLKVTCIGGAGGGGGGKRPVNSTILPGGNGGRGYIKTNFIAVTPKSVYVITVGEGGLPGSRNDSYINGIAGTGGTGSISSFSTLISASGGNGGVGSSKTDIGGVKGVDGASNNNGAYYWCSIGGSGGYYSANLLYTEATVGSAGAVIVEW